MFMGTVLLQAAPGGVREGAGVLTLVQAATAILCTYVRRYEPVFLMQQMPTGKTERRRKEKCLFSSSPGPFRAASSPPLRAV